MLHSRCRTGHTRTCELTPAWRSKREPKPLPDAGFIVAMGPVLDVQTYDDLVDLAYGDWPATWPMTLEDFLAEGRRQGRQFQRLRRS